MKRIAIILIWFGKLPGWFDLWNLSCSYNSTIDFFIITDQEITNKYDNIKIIPSSLSEIKVKIEHTLDMDISLDRPYKICDFRPAFGVIFNEMLAEYDYWGYCDCDLMFGDIRSFLTEEKLEKYDKIYKLGHLSLYKNTREVNWAFKKDGSLVGGYQKVFNSNETFAFDEQRGIWEILRKHKFNLYANMDFVDIRSNIKEFRNATRIYSEAVNYDPQIFFWEKGKLYRAYLSNNEIKTDSIIYIHFQKRNMKLDKKLCDSVDEISGFYIGPNIFIKKDEDISIDSFHIFDKNTTLLAKWKYVISRRINAYLKRIKIKWREFYDYSRF